MEKQGHKLLTYSLVIATIAFVLGAALKLLGVFSFLENKTYDSRTMVTAPLTKVSDEICFIGIDQESINRAQKEKGWGWPWPRSAYADIVDFMKEGGAHSVTFDVFFTEPSVYGNEDDERFATACKNNGSVVQIMFKSDTDGNLLFPIESIRNSAALIGNATSAKDKDDIIRRGRVSYNYNGTEYPSLGLAPMLLSSTDIQSDLNSIKQNLNADKDGTVLLRYKGSLNRYAHYSAYDVLTSWENYKNGAPSELSPQDFKDCIVYFIFYAPGLYDICSTPVSQIYPGAGVHMTLLDNYLTGDFVKHTPIWCTLFYCFLTSFMAAGIILLIGKLNPRHSDFLIGLLFICGIVFIFALAYGLFIKSIFIEIIAPLFCFVLSYVAIIFLNYSLEGKQKRFIKSAFSQYLSPFVIDRLIANPDQLKLGGEKRRISIFFSDVQSFTTLSESLEPEKLTEVLNRYLTEMSEIILTSGGTIDKYEGDAIIAFWNAPTDTKDHAKLAIEAAIKCQKRLKELEPEFMELVGRPMWTRIGINTGDAVVGNMGSNLRFDYTMFGDAVNLASRLEGLNKQFGTFVMCTSITKDEAIKDGTDLRWRELARAAVVGKKEAVTVFEPIPVDEYEEKKPYIEKFESALKLFYNGDFINAKNQFDAISGKDKPALFYSEKCTELIANPPKEEWRGIWQATSK